MSLRVLRSLTFVLVATAVGIIGACTPSAPQPITPPPPTVNAPTVAAEPPVFRDVTAASGIAFTYRNGEEAGHLAIIESLGGGVALFDYDGDGLFDIFLTGGGKYEGKKVLGQPCRLFRNLGDFHFEDLTTAAGLDKVDFPYSHGAAAFDYDRDGRLDILITGYNRLVLLHNEVDAKGNQRFVDVSKSAGLTETLWSTSAAWGDLNGDGFPEIYVCHYGDWGFETNHPTDCTYDGKTHDVCAPRKFKPLPHKLYRNNGNGTFTDVSEAVKLRTDGRGIGVIMVDVNGDARPDIYAANDTDDNFLYVNRGTAGGLVLEELGLIAGVARDDLGVANGSMGVDASDFDRSGKASILVTNYENELPALYRNMTTDRRPWFVYDTQRSGLGVIGGSYVSWGTGFFDSDNDGWEDIFIVSGHAIRYPKKIDRRQKPVLLRNTNGRFTPAKSNGWEYLGEPHNARGAAFGDLNNDGKIDVVVSHLNEPTVILRNVASSDANHWVGLRLVGEKGADIVGARVVVETPAGRQTRFVKGGASYGSTNDNRLHFGLGIDTKILKATVFWPSGKTHEVSGLEVDSYWEIVEGQADSKRIRAK